MRSLVTILMISSTVTAGILVAQNPPAIKKVPVSQTSPAAGKVPPDPT